MRKGKEMFVPAKYCDQCGAKLDADSKFCTSCGAKLPEPMEVKQPEPQPKDPEETLDQIPVESVSPDYDGEETVYIGANAGFGEPESTEQRFSRLAPIAELKKERSGEKIVIDRPEFVLGKNPNHTDFAIRDNNTVSRIHASITWDEEGYKIVDLGSMNGTFVNGSKIGVDGELLKDGDVIELSDEIFRLSMREA